MRFRTNKAFTIVELLMVIGIIGVLMGIVTTAASGAVKNSRVRRSQALCALVQQGLAVYHAQKGEWPIGLSGRSSNDRNNSSVIVLSGTEVRECVRKLCEETKKGNPLIDVSGLFVSRSDGEWANNGSNDSSGNAASGAHKSGGGGGKAGYGLDFMHAIHGTSKSSRKMKLNEMYFGYQDSSTGKFLRFYMTYSIPTDSITVTYWPNRGW